jgi:hypothetical protein
MKYIPKTLPLLGVSIPDEYHQGAHSVIEAFEQGDVRPAFNARPHLLNMGVATAINHLNATL